MRPRQPLKPPITKSVDKALRILQEVANAGSDVGVQELAGRVGVNASTTYRLLRSLEAHRLVVQDPGSGRYRIGLGVIELARTALDSLEIRKLARPLLEKLAMDTGESAHLMVRDGMMGVYIDRVEGPQRVRVASEIGRREYLHCSAVGKALLANLPAAERSEIIRRVGLPRLTARTITDPAQLEAQLQQVREQGYAIDLDEGEEGIRCVGAPVFDGDGKLVASISCSAPSYRMPAERLHEVAPLVVEAARRLSSQLGYEKGGAQQGFTRW